MTVFWVQFEYRKDGRANGAQYWREYVVVGEGLTEATARAVTGQRERLGFSGHTLREVKAQDRTDGFVRGQIIFVKEDRP